MIGEPGGSERRSMLAMFEQANGEAGVRQTLRKMASLVVGSMADPVIRDQAAAAMAGCPKGQKVCHALALLMWVNRKVQYVPDPFVNRYQIELVHDPRLMARGIAEGKQVYGDCDDMSVYLGALMGASGLAPVFRAVGYDGQPFSHVYVRFGGLKLDATRDSWQVSLIPHRETIVLEEQV